MDGTNQSAMDNLTASTDLWLDIKTVYIDENFDKVLTYLHCCSACMGDPALVRSIDEICVEIIDIENGTCSIDSEFVKFIIEEWAKHDFGREVLPHYMDTNVDRSSRHRFS